MPMPTPRSRRKEPALLVIRRGGRRLGGASGFTLLEVLIALAILGISLSSMMASQVNSLAATGYARDLSAAALLAEWKITDLETQMRRDGWTNSDVDVDGDFADQGWDDFSYRCTVHFIELPEYNQLIEAKEGADELSGEDSDNLVDAGDQMFGALGLVWPIVKTAIETSIRKVDCTVSWTRGEVEHEYDVQTFWTDPAALTQLPQAGGEFTDADDNSGDEEAGGTGSTGGTGAGGGRGGGGGTLPPSRGGQPGGMNMGGNKP